MKKAKDDLAGLTLPVKAVVPGVARSGPMCGLFTIKLLLSSPEEGWPAVPLTDVLSWLQHEFKKHPNAYLLSVADDGTLDAMTHPALYYLHREMLSWSRGLTGPDLPKHNNQFCMQIYTRGQTYNPAFNGQATMLHAQARSLVFVTQVIDKGVSEQMRSLCKHWIYNQADFEDGHWDWRSLPWRSDAYLVTALPWEAVMPFVAETGMRYQRIG